MPIGGVQYTHPFEAWFVNFGYQPRIPFPANFHKTMALYYDQEPMRYNDVSELARRDASWRTRQGKAFLYARESMEDNQFLLYPRPSAVWDDISGSKVVGGGELVTNGGFDTTTGWTFDADYWFVDDSSSSKACYNEGGQTEDLEQTVAITAGDSYTYSFVITLYTAGTLWFKVGGDIIVTVTANGTYTGSAVAGSSNSLLEITAQFDFDGCIDTVSLIEPAVDKPPIGPVHFVAGDTTESEIGNITQRTGSFLTYEVGVATDVLDAAGNIVLVYDVAPVPVTGTGDRLDYPDFMSKYVRYGVLGRAYMANTDGYIPSLANYWNQRYRLGVKALKHYRANKARNRARRFATETLSARRTIRHPRLPDGYPVV